MSRLDHFFTMRKHELVSVWAGVLLALVLLSPLSVAGDSIHFRRDARWLPIWGCARRVAGRGDADGRS
jgi:hypothetical protein